MFVGQWLNGQFLSVTSVTGLESVIRTPKSTKIDVDSRLTISFDEINGPATLGRGRVAKLSGSDYPKLNLLACQGRVSP